jgi:hypothetical protein
MRVIKSDPAHGGFADNHHLSARERQSLLSVILKNTMDSMQQQLESMIPPSTSHTNYVKFCQYVASHLRAYTNNIRPLTDFFIRHSIHYWPKGDDPHLYAAGIVSYSLRLQEQPGKTSFELFHYLYSGWKNDQMHHRMNSHVMCVRKGMKNWSFTEFMLANFVPATILVGFDTPMGAVLPKIYLPALAKRIPHYLQRNGAEGAICFAHLINILKIIINGISILAANALVPDGVQNGQRILVGEHGVRRDHQGIISIVCQFWIGICPALLDYVGVHPDEASLLDEVASPLNDFFRKAILYLDRNERNGWDIYQLDATVGDYVDRFVAALHDDIKNHWTIWRWADSVCIKFMGTREDGGTTVSLLEGVPTLEDVLKLGMCYLDGVGRQYLLSR